MNNRSRQRRLARYDKVLSNIHTARKTDIMRQLTKKLDLVHQSEHLDATDNSQDAIAYLDHRLAYRTALVRDIADISKDIMSLEDAAKTLELARDRTREAIVHLRRDIDAAEANELLQEFVAQSCASSRQAPDKS